MNISEEDQDFISSFRNVSKQKIVENKHNLHPKDLEKLFYMSDKTFSTKENIKRIVCDISDIYNKGSNNIFSKAMMVVDVDNNFNMNKKWNLVMYFFQ